MMTATGQCFTFLHHTAFPHIFHLFSCHNLFFGTKEKIEYKGMKNVEVMFPVIEDISMNVAKLYGMAQPNSSTTQAVRAVFIIDPKAIVRTITYYPASAGRNMQEIKRVIIAMQKADSRRCRRLSVFV
jgi:alkyl hydroperoxide reductase subunit AhpC